MERLRIGTLSTARITPPALIAPARQVPEAVVTAVAARDPAQAEAFAAEHGIPVVLDMPGVGAHLHDHFNTYLVWRCTQKVTLNDMARSPLRILQAGIGYVLTRSGPMSNAGVYAGAMVKSEANHQTWTRIGKYDLPLTVRVVSADKGTVRAHHIGDLGPDSYSVKSATLSNNKLLATEGAQK